MRHHKYNREFKFVQEPEEFSKYSDREFLRFCLGATLYMPGTKDFVNKILNKEIHGLTTIVYCFEDACPEEDVEAAEINVINTLETLSSAIDKGELTYSDLPLIFCRVRTCLLYTSRCV